MFLKCVNMYRHNNKQLYFASNESLTCFFRATPVGHLVKLTALLLNKILYKIKFTFYKMPPVGYLMNLVALLFFFFSKLHLFFNDICW